MDEIFKMTAVEFDKALFSVEAEMLQKYYMTVKGSKMALEVHKNGKGLIHYTFRFMKAKFNTKSKTMIVLMEEVLKVGQLGEYKYIVGNLSDPSDSSEQSGSKAHKYPNLSERSGMELKHTVLYAMRLLFEYYNSEKSGTPKPSDYARACELMEKAVNLKIPADKNFVRDSIEGNIPEDAFMSIVRSHLDKHYVGQELLKKKVIAMLYQWIYYGERSVMLMVGPTGSGKSHMIRCLASCPDFPVPIVTYDASTLTPNGFSGADVSDVFKQIAKKMRINSPFGKADRNHCDHAILFLDEVDKIINYNHDSNGESVNAVVQQQLLTALSGVDEICGVDTSKLLIIMGGAFPRIDDLEKQKMNPVGFLEERRAVVDGHSTLREKILEIGCEKEFLGRVSDIVRMEKLTREDLKTLLLDSRIGVFVKKQRLYAKSGLALFMEDDVAEEILKMAERDDAGARSVRNIVNQLADNQYFYDMKVNGYDTMTIHKGMLYGESPIYGKKTSESQRTA